MDFTPKGNHRRNAEVPAFKKSQIGKALVACSARSLAKTPGRAQHQLLKNGLLNSGWDFFECLMRLMRKRLTEGLKKRFFDREKHRASP